MIWKHLARPLGDLLFDAQEPQEPAPRPRPAQGSSERERRLLEALERLVNRVGREYDPDPYSDGPTFGAMACRGCGATRFSAVEGGDRFGHHVGCPIAVLDELRGR